MKYLNWYADHPVLGTIILVMICLTLVEYSPWRIK